MPSFEIPANVFTNLSVFGSPKGSSDTFKTHKNIRLYFKRRHLIIYKDSKTIQYPGIHIYILHWLDTACHWQNFGVDFICVVLKDNDSMQHSEGHYYTI